MFLAAALPGHSLLAAFTFTPPAPEHYVLLGAGILLAAALAWRAQGKKITQLQGLLADREKDHATALASHAAQAASEVDALQRKLNDASIARAMLEEKLAAQEEKAAAQERQFAAWRAAAERREKEAGDRLMAAGADLVATRQIAAQLEPTRARIGDLEQALTAERGRVAALEQTLEVTRGRLEELDRHLQDAQNLFSQTQANAAAREAELHVTLVAARQVSAETESARAEVAAELQALKDTHEAYQKQAETRLANLQRQVAAAEAKAALVQKEFMTAIGTLPDPDATRGPAVDRQVAELEAKLSQMEAEARKKAREDSYKIAELEFRLTEAREAPKAPAPASNSEERVATLEAQLAEAMQAQQAAEQRLGLLRHQLARATSSSRRSSKK